MPVTFENSNKLAAYLNLNTTSKPKKAPKFSTKYNCLNLPQLLVNKGLIEISRFLLDRHRIFFQKIM